MRAFRVKDISNSWWCKTRPVQSWKNLLRTRLASSHLRPHSNFIFCLRSNEFNPIILQHWMISMMSHFNFEWGAWLLLDLRSNPWVLFVNLRMNRNLLKAKISWILFGEVSLSKVKKNLCPSKILCILSPFWSHYRYINDDYHF